VLYFYNPTTRELELTVDKNSMGPTQARVGLGVGIAGQVALTRQSLVVGDYSTWEHRNPNDPTPYRTAMAVPLLYSGEFIGVLVLGDFTATGAFSEADKHLLELFASHAAGAVHTARLLGQTQQRANQLAALYDAGIALNSVLEPHAQLEFLFKIAIRAVHADRAEFFRYEPSRNELYFELGVGHPPETLTRLMGLSLQAEDENDIVGWVSKYRVPLFVPDVYADARWHADSNSEIQAGIWVAV
jgi:GAF domain-containing protein